MGYLSKSYTLPVLFSNRVDQVNDLLVMAGLLWQEEDYMRFNFTTKNLLSGFMVEFDDEWQTLDGDEFLQISLGEFVREFWVTLARLKKKNIRLMVGH